MDDNGTCHICTQYAAMQPIVIFGVRKRTSKEDRRNKEVDPEVSHVIIVITYTVIP